MPCMRAWSAAAFALAPLVVTGCTSLSPRGDYDRAGALVTRAVGQPLGHGPGAADGVAALIEELLGGGLTADEAVQLCLVNNAQLQAAFHAVGIARADLVQSELFSNPTLALAVRFPDGGGMAGLDLDLVQNIAELWQIPYRRKAAARQLDRAVLELARRAAGLAWDTKAAYHRALGADRECALTSETLVVMEQLVEIATGRRDAGLGSEIDVNLAESQYLEAQIRLRSTELAAAAARADLARLLGLTLAPAELVLTEAADVPRDWELTIGDLVAAAREHRLDLRIAAETAGMARAQIDFEKTRFLREIELGVSVERDARASRGDRKWLAEAAWASLDAGELAAPSVAPREPQSTDWAVGPAISLQIPVFDQNQAGIARAREEYAQACKFLEALQRGLVQDAWEALERARAARDLTRMYGERLLPLRERSLTLAREAYRAGRVTILAVLEAQRELLAARAAHVQVLRDAAFALVELERLTALPAVVLLHTAGGTEATAQESPGLADPAAELETAP